MAQGEWKATKQFIGVCETILKAEHPMTVRQLFYRLVSVGVVANTKPDYSRVSRMMTKARRDERIPYEWLVDRSRPTYSVNVWQNPASFVQTVARSYRHDYWYQQPTYCEVWCEKDAVTGSIEDTVRELGVTLRVTRGFMSATRVNDIAQHLRRIRKPKTVFYLGDHDPSGHSIEETAVDAVLERMNGFKSGYDVMNVSVQRLAIHAADIRLFNLPPLLVKDTDPRAEEFEAEHGKDCVELDALPPTELRRRIDEAVMGLVNRAAWDKSMHLEKVETDSIIDVCNKWPQDYLTDV
jgi:hypothetical protein